MIGNGISRIYGASGEGRYLIETKKIGSKVSGRNRSIFNRGFFPSGSNRHLHVRLTPADAANPAISIPFILLLFCPPPLPTKSRMVWYPPSADNRPRYQLVASIFYQFPDLSLTPLTRRSSALTAARATYTVFKISPFSTFSITPSVLPRPTYHNQSSDRNNSEFSCSIIKIYERFSTKKKGYWLKLKRRLRLKWGIYMKK